MNPAVRDFLRVYLGTGFGIIVGFVINSQGSSNRASSKVNALKSVSSFCIFQLLIQID